MSNKKRYTDVTGGDPESDSSNQWWYCSWSQIRYRASPLSGPPASPTETDVRYEMGVATHVSGFVRSANMPTAEDFADWVIVTTNGVSIPTPERDQWWEWSPTGWAPSSAIGVWISADLWYGRLYGTSADREEKRSRLVEAARFAGE